MNVRTISELGQRLTSLLRQIRTHYGWAGVADAIERSLEQLTLAERERLRPESARALKRIRQALNLPVD